MAKKARLKLRDYLAGLLHSIPLWRTSSLSLRGRRSATTDRFVHTGTKFVIRRGSIDGGRPTV
jgi:hypothetical protein